MPKIELRKPSLLLHICCIGCGVAISKSLQDEFSVTLYFYNPNIYPAQEYAKRLEETKKVAQRFKIPLIKADYDHSAWLRLVKGLENEKERGRRCLVCYLDRLERTAKQAKEEMGFEYFSTTLTVSPHKDAVVILDQGNNLAKKYGLKFLSRDFKKNNGFKEATSISKELKLYRQNYCGCEFSFRTSKL